MKSLLNLILIVLILTFTFPVFAAEVNSVLIISIDALHPAAMGPYTTPHMNGVMTQGVFTLDGRSTAPPLTLLSHAAMFSGRGPEQGGRKHNNWRPGEPVIKGETIFDFAKSNGFSTGFFYSKEKLGYLVTDAVDRHELDPDFSIENGLDFFMNSYEKTFCFLHVSGLDRSGPVDGWMSEGYMEELLFIDQSIAPLINLVISKGNYLIFITSDHAGHGRVHGSDHPDDAKLPLVMVSDVADLRQYQGASYQVTQLKAILETCIPYLFK